MNLVLASSNLTLHYITGTAIKRQAHNNFAGLLYGLAFTKPNEAFLKTVEEKFSKDSKILLVCQEGLRLRLFFFGGEISKFDFLFYVKIWNSHFSA